ncbi:MAG TPA: CBS domain-containing protein [Candidatus Saccharicenans sp.]|jgi:CBS domain-containing protein|nr:CBS domain-containing protein [Candidatus Saccharicenans sp.]
MITVKQMLEQKGPEVWTISPEATVYEALKIMADKDLGALIVVENDQVVGIMSERDYARKVMLRGKSSLDTPVKDIMSTEIYYVGPEVTAEECLALMIAKRMRHLPVINKGKLIGVISMGDVVKSIISTQKVAIEHLQNYIMGKYQ